MKSIFLEALERPAGPGRLAYLEGACGNDPELRAEVEELLDAHDRASGFLGSSLDMMTSTSRGELDTDASPDERDAPVAAQPSEASGDMTVDTTDPPDAMPSPISRPIAEGPGSRIGPYNLRERIGEGGMGVV
jgi:hypothetical protein